MLMAYSKAPYPKASHPPFKSSIFTYDQILILNFFIFLKYHLLQRISR